MQDGETEWNRGVPEIGAAQVEQPRDVGRVGDDQRILLAVGKRLADFSAFVFRASAGIGQRVGTRRVGGRLGPVGPDPVDRIGVHRFHPQPGLAKAGKALRAGQPGIVADTGVRGRMSGDPGRGRIVGDVPALPQCGIGLGLDLQSIAAIGEHGGACPASTTAKPALPVKPVSQARRSAEGGTYSPRCSSARGIRNPCRSLRASSARRAESRSDGEAIGPPMRV